MSDWTRKWITGAKGLPPKWLLALDSHIAWGFGVASWFGWWAGNFVAGAVVIILVALFKETVLDPYFENAPFIWNGLFDWLEYFVGIGLAAGVGYLLAHYFHLPLHWL